MFLLSANVDLINFAVQKIVIHTGFFWPPWRNSYSPCKNYGAVNYL